MRPASSVAATTAFLTLFSLACSRTQSAAGPPATAPTPVALAAATTTAIEDATEYVATLKSLRSTAVQPQIEGQVTQVLVKSGDRIRDGASLFQIDPRRQQAAVASQQAELSAKEAAVAFARQQQQRSNELYKAGAISRQELETTETALHRAE